MGDDVKNVEIPTVPAERTVTPAEYQTRYFRMLQALDLPAHLDGTHVLYGDMTDEEGTWHWLWCTSLTFASPKCMTKMRNLPPESFC